MQVYGFLQFRGRERLWRWTYASTFGAAVLSSLFVTAAGGLAARPAEAVDDQAEADSQRVQFEFALLDVRGTPHSLRADPERAASVFVFLSTDCPIANAYIPELNRQFTDLPDGRRVDFFGVISDRAITRAAAAKHADDFKIAFPVLFDASGLLAAALRPTHTPEAFVVDRAGKIAYRGRIDDLFGDLDKKRAAVSRHDLADALASVLAGKPVATPRTEPVGCLVETAPAGASKTGPTYNRDIAPILQANCMNCHREGEIAPFPLMTHADAARRAKQIIRVTQSRFMPPWRPEPGFGHFLGERRLSERELALFREWGDSGTPEGKADDLPAAPKFSEGWLLGEPDLVVKMEEPFEVPADGPDVFRNFVIPTSLGSDKLVTVAEFRPGNRRVVHHSIFYLDNSGAARRRDAGDPGPGYSTFGGPGFLPIGSIGGWAPGGAPQALRDGMGRQIPKGADIVLQIHYHPTGKPEIDQSSIGIHFVREPSRKLVVPLTIVDRGLYIPEGAERHPMSGSYVLPNDVTLVGITPHMHLLGREMKVTAKSPQGQTTPLIWIKDWSFNWQDQYVFAEPLRLAKGTQIDVTAVYDNSEKNPLNPNTPPKTVTWGEQTTDEMFICFFLATTDDPDQLLPLIIDNARAMGSRMKRARK